MLTKTKILQVLHDNKNLLSDYGVIEIGLFGSFQKEAQHKDSDIDIIVHFDEHHETFDNLMAVYDILEKAFKNYKIDVVTKNGLSKYIGSYILEETEYV